MTATAASSRLYFEELFRESLRTPGALSGLELIEVNVFSTAAHIQKGHSGAFDGK